MGCITAEFGSSCGGASESTSGSERLQMSPTCDENGSPSDDGIMAENGDTGDPGAADRCTCDGTDELLQLDLLQGFFRRSIQQKIQYRPCTKNQQCSILRINRNRCQYCRLKKCIAVGMSRDGEYFEIFVC